MLAGWLTWRFASRTPGSACHEPQREPLVGDDVAAGWRAAEQFRRLKGWEDGRSAPRSSPHFKVAVADGGRLGGEVDQAAIDIP
jgi:hypothetical protein